MYVIERTNDDGKTEFLATDGTWDARPERAWVAIEPHQGFTRAAEGRRNGEDFRGARLRGCMVDRAVIRPSKFPGFVTKAIDRNYADGRVNLFPSADKPSPFYVTSINDARRVPLGRKTTDLKPLDHFDGHAFIVTFRDATLTL